MKRPLCVTGFTILLFTTASFFISAERGLWFAGAIFLTALLLALWRRVLQPLALIGCAAALGLLVGSLYQQDHLLPFQNLLGQPVLVQGTITEAAKTSDRNMRYTLSAQFPGSGLPDSTFVLRDYTGSEYSAGQQISAIAELQQPKYRSTQSYYARQGIPAEGVLLEWKQAPDYLLGFWEQLLLRSLHTRETIAQKNQQHLPESTAALVNGMVFDMTQDLPPNLYSDLNRSGTSHLLSVSGLHLAILSGFIIYLLQAVGVGRRLSTAAALLVATIFLLVVGAFPALARSYLMLVLFLLAEIVGRRSDSLTSLGIAAIIVAVARPYWALSPGTWLSFLATGGIVTLGTKLSRWLEQRYAPKGCRLRKLRIILLSGLAVTVGASLPTMPLLLLISGELSLVVPLANILVAPFASFVVVGGILSALLPAGILFYPLLLWLLNVCSRMIIALSREMAALPFAALAVDSGLLFVAILVVFALLALGVWCAIKAQRQRVYLILLAAAIILSSAKSYSLWQAQSQLELVQLAEVETALLIRGNSAVLVGQVNRYQAEELIRYLHFRGIRQIDALVLPEHDGNVDSGMLRLHQSFPIRAVLGPDDALVLDLLAQAYPGVPVHASGYATAEVLGLAQIRVAKNSSDVEILVAGQKILIHPEKYDIMEAYPRSIHLFSDQTILTLPAYPVKTFLMGSWVFGERRMILL